MTYPNRKKLTEYPIVTPTLADSVVNIQGNTVKRSTLQSILALFSANSPSPTLPYKVFSGLIWQTGGTFLQNKNAGGTLDKGVTYYIVSNGGYDFIPLGAPSNTVGTYFICNQNITTGLGIPFDLQYDTGAPICAVLENTIGNIWFTYDNLGKYGIFSNDLFDHEKTMYFNQSLPMNAVGVKMLLYIPATSQFQIETYNSSNVLDDSLLEDYTPIEIRIYD
jgi:hypothetical protein